MTDHSLGYGVIYEPESFAGFFRRFIIISVDLSIVIALFYFGLELDSYFYVEYDDYYEDYSTYTMILIIYLYLTVIKSSKLGTFGLLLTGTKIVTLKGQKPNIFKMTFRFLFLLLGPINGIIDFLWLTMNPEKRTFRDCICGTYIIRKNASPIGEGPIHLSRVGLMGQMFLYPSVFKNENSSSNGPKVD